MGRSSFMVRLVRWVQSSPLWLFRVLEWPFVALLARCSNNTQAIFVLALPRSGSTVTYQTICHGLSVNYLSNLWHLLYQLPLLGGWLSGLLAQRHCSDFSSQQGFVSGLDGPAEGLRFWRWWLDCGLSDPDCEIQSRHKHQRRGGYLCRVLSVLARRHGPFSSAYLGHTLVPDRLHDTFPGAVLIRVRREPVSNALSLLKSMRAGNTDWFSVLPKECEGLEGASEHERVALQVYWLNRRLDNASCADEMLDVHYERLCEHPGKEMERIHQWCHIKGVSVEFKFSLPDKFSYRMADLEADTDAIKIRQKMDELEEKHGQLRAAG